MNTDLSSLCRRSAFVITALAASSSCSSTEPLDSAVSEARQSSRSLPDLSVSVQTVDFGDVIGSDEPIEQTFKIFNSSSEPMRILKAGAMTPCCSEVMSVEERIGPGQHAAVRVRFHPKQRRGGQRIEFVVLTDSSFSPKHVLRLIGTIHPASEIQKDSPFDAYLGIRQAGVQTFRVVRRHLERHDPVEPIAVEGSAFVRPRLEFVSTDVVDGLSEDVFKLSVEVDPDDATGPHRGEAVISWSISERERYPIDWHVQPSVAVYPKGLAVEREKVPFEVVVRLKSLDGRPFRVSSAQSRNLRVEIDGDGLRSEEHAIARFTFGRHAANNIDMG